MYGNHRPWGFHWLLNQKVISSGILHIKHSSFEKNGYFTVKITTEKKKKQHIFKSDGSGLPQYVDLS